MKKHFLLSVIGLGGLFVLMNPSQAHSGCPSDMTFPACQGHCKVACLLNTKIYCKQDQNGDMYCNEDGICAIPCHKRNK